MLKEFHHSHMCTLYKKGCFNLNEYASNQSQNFSQILLKVLVLILYLNIDEPIRCQEKKNNNDASKWFNIIYYSIKKFSVIG